MKESEREREKEKTLSVSELPLLSSNALPRATPHQPYSKKCVCVCECTWVYIYIYIKASQRSIKETRTQVREKIFGHRQQ